MAFLYDGGSDATQPKEISFSKMTQYAAAQEIAEINITETTITAVLDNEKEVYACCKYSRPAVLQ